MPKKISISQLKNLFLYLIVYYNFFLNLLIIWTSVIIIMYHGNAFVLSSYLQNLNFIESSSILKALSIRLSHFQGIRVELFMSIMLLLAVIEVIFLTAIIMKRRWGIIGFTLSSIIWLPIQIKLIISFLSITRVSVFIINILVILFLVSFIKNTRNIKKT